VSKPFLKYFYFTADGCKPPDIEIPVTENHAIIPDQQIVFKLQEMVLGGWLPRGVRQEQDSTAAASTSGTRGRTRPRARSW
jgi:hypothetical protein